MKFSLVFLILATVFGCAGRHAQHKPNKRLFAAFQQCVIACQTIKLNEDFTFDYLVDGDLFNDERAKGEWKFIADNKIYLKTLDKPLPKIKVAEKNGGNKKNISVLVVDFVGAIFPGIQITALSNGKETSFVTDENGYCEIPLSEAIKISYLTQQTVYKLQNQNTNEITIEITADETPALEGTFVFNRKEICEISIPGEGKNCYGRIKESEERKLFPAEKPQK